MSRPKTRTHKPLRPPKGFVFFGETNQGTYNGAELPILSSVNQTFLRSLKKLCFFHPRKRTRLITLDSVLLLALGCHDLAFPTSLSEEILCCLEIAARIESLNFVIAKRATAMTSLTSLMQQLPRTPISTKRPSDRCWLAPLSESRPGSLDNSQLLASGHDSKSRNTEGPAVTTRDAVTSLGDGGESKY